MWFNSKCGYIICAYLYFIRHTQTDKMLPTYMICTSQNWHVCGCDMHQHEATSTFWTFVSSSLGGSVPAAELLTLWSFSNQREADLRTSAASWNPLWGPRENGSPMHCGSLPHESIIYRRWRGRHIENTHVMRSHTQRHTNTLWALPQLPWQCHNSCVWTENQVLHLKAQLGLSSATWIQQTGQPSWRLSINVSVSFFCSMLTHCWRSLSWIKNHKVCNN